MSRRVISIPTKDRKWLGSIFVSLTSFCISEITDIHTFGWRRHDSNATGSNVAMKTLGTAGLLIISRLKQKMRRNDAFIGWRRKNHQGLSSSNKSLIVWTELYIHMRRLSSILFIQ